MNVELTKEEIEVLRLALYDYQNGLMEEIKIALSTNAGHATFYNAIQLKYYISCRIMIKTGD